MEEARRRARRCVVFCALYMAIASLLTVWELMIPLVFAPMVGLICTAECFDAGRCYQFEMERDFDELKFFGEPRCEVCHGKDFREIAGRLVCNTCGEVMGVDHGTDQT